MLLKKNTNRDSLRGLSHEQKVKRVQKITRVPLQNLKTNIAQSDLEQDDISVPICLKLSSNVIQQTQPYPSYRNQSKAKVYDQQQINRTIRTMTEELNTLELGKQKSPTNAAKRHERVVSIFSIKVPQLVPSHSEDDVFASKQLIQDFYSTSKNGESTEKLSIKELSQISVKLQHLKNQNISDRDYCKGKRDFNERNTEPIYFNQENEPCNNLFSPKGDKARKKEDAESQMSKRFSRNKRQCEQSNEPKIQKKLKFNRSNQKNTPINKIINKENDDLNIYTTKKMLLSERLSFETIPTHESLENEFKKRKNVGKNFMGYENESNRKGVSFHKIEEGERAGITEEGKNSLRRAIGDFELLSKNEMFKKLQQGKIEQVMEKRGGKEFMLTLYRKYRQSIGVIKSIQ